MKKRNLITYFLLAAPFLLGNSEVNSSKNHNTLENIHYNEPSTLQGSIRDPVSFVTIESNYQGDVSMLSGDFDNDGDLDLIIGASRPNSPYFLRVYFFKNDGKGNFFQ